MTAQLWFVFTVKVREGTKQETGETRARANESHTLANTRKHAKAKVTARATCGRSNAFLPT